MDGTGGGVIAANVAGVRHEVDEVKPGRQRESLDKFAGDLRATHPHFVYTPRSAPQALHNAGRLAWGSGPRGETRTYTGLDVVIVRDGKIAALYVFLDSVPS